MLLSKEKILRYTLKTAYLMVALSYRITAVPFLYSDAPTHSIQGECVNCPCSRRDGQIKKLFEPFEVARMNKDVDAEPRACSLQFCHTF
jgi:hypothetical protein